jgi:hypothetical protein
MLRIGLPARELKKENSFATEIPMLIHRQTMEEKKPHRRIEQEEIKILHTWKKLQQKFLSPYMEEIETSTYPLLCSSHQQIEKEGSL